MTNPETVIRPNEKPTIIDRLLGFMIVFLAFTILDRFFDFLVPSWNRPFFWSALSASIFALLIALFRPQFYTPLSRWALRSFLKNKTQ